MGEGGVSPRLPVQPPYVGGTTLLGEEREGSSEDGGGHIETGDGFEGGGGGVGVEGVAVEGGGGTTPSHGGVEGGEAGGGEGGGGGRAGSEGEERVCY